jgi:dipeptidyl aminopeptidase/acylaminoacyl peptidase
LGYPGDDTLFVTRRGEEFTLQPPGRKRIPHSTYPSLARDGSIVATSYAKSPNPAYREGIATYSLADKRWIRYDGGNFTHISALAISPDGSMLAFKAERDWRLPSQLLLLNLGTGEMRVLTENYLPSAPVTWSPDGHRVAYAYPVGRPVPDIDVTDYEVRIMDIRNQQERRLVMGSDPSWSPSGEWIAYRDGRDGIAMVRPDGTGMTALVRLRRRFPWFGKRSFMYSPVWSRDSSELLLNEDAADETGRTSIHRIALGDRQLRKVKGNGVAVLGWTREHKQIVEPR